MKKIVILATLMAIIIFSTSCGALNNIVEKYIHKSDSDASGIIVETDAETEEEIINVSANTDVTEDIADEIILETEESAPAVEHEVVDFNDYLGTWTGEAALDVYMPNKNIIEISFCQSNFNATRLAFVEMAIPISSINGNSVEFSFVDSWYNTGKMTVEFGNKLIECTISDIEYSEDALFGVSEGFYPLVRSGNTMKEEYYNNVEAIEQDSYILNTHTDYIVREDLVGYSKETVALIRNEIYARHGYIFKNKTFSDYFSAQSWYSPNPGYSNDMLSATENYNINIITEYEKEMGWK